MNYFSSVEANWNGSWNFTFMNDDHEKIAKFFEERILQAEKEGEERVIKNILKSIEIIAKGI